MLLVCKFIRARTKTDLAWSRTALSHDKLRISWQIPFVRLRLNCFEEKTWARKSREIVPLKGLILWKMRAIVSDYKWTAHDLQCLVLGWDYFVCNYIFIFIFISIYKNCFTVLLCWRIGSELSWRGSLLYGDTKERRGAILVFCFSRKYCLQFLNYYNAKSTLSEKQDCGSTSGWIKNIHR